MEHRHPVIWGTMILTLAGLLSRFIGFFYRIFLSHTIGAEGVGIYQLIFPVYTLCFALTVFGIQTSISRFVAAQLARGNQQKANDTFLLGSSLALIFAGLAALFVHQNAQWIGTSLLSESRTVPLLRLLAYSIPLGAIHTCVNAYYYARKQTEIPAISQLLEQIVRVGASYLVYLILLSQGAAVNALIAVAGILAGELASMLYSTLLASWSLHRQNYHLLQMKNPLTTLQKILTLSLPLTGNRVLLTLLTSVEQILIPSRLRLFGLSGANALSLFGILTGMSLPLLLFPSTITNSVSVMLLPSVAEQQALGKEEQIRRTTLMTIKGCLFLGVGCFLLFFFFGDFMGMLLFDNATAGAFLKALSFICPFLYLNTTLMSILNGLGKTGYCFLHNLAALTIRIAFTFFCIPLYGIKGYLWGVLLGELLLTVLNLITLRRFTGIGLNLKS